MSDSATQWTVACQVPLSTGFSSKNTGVGFAISFSKDLPNPGLKPMSPALQGILYHLSHQGSPASIHKYTHLHCPAPPSHSSRSSPSTERSLLCCVAASYELSILHTVVPTQCCWLWSPCCTLHRWGSILFNNWWIWFIYTELESLKDKVIWYKQSVHKTSHHSECFRFHWLYTEHVFLHVLFLSPLINLFILNLLLLWKGQRILYCC